VHKRILPIATAAFLFSLIIAGCTKLDTTDIGSDLLPAVDNVNTFDTVLEIKTTQPPPVLDTTKVANTDDHVVGKISNDPLFGTTTASIYAQFKPTFYPYYYGNANDTIIGFDSVILCLSYKGFWGDSITQPLNLQVRQVSLTAGGTWDSVYYSKDINFAPAVFGPVLGSTQVNFNTLGNTIVYRNGKDSVKNQIRINLSSSAFASALYTLDSTGNHAFRSDSLYKALFDNGLAITASTGNGLLYTNLTDSSSKLEVHFRRKNGGIPDTAYAAFKVYTAFGSSISPSATADNIIRTRPAQITNPPANPTELYLQTTPGTYANLTIPALSTLSNRIIHRAEIIIEQIPFSQPSDSYFSAPNFLYIDLKDTGTTEKWKPIYFDLNPTVAYDPDFLTNSDFPSGGVDFGYFGGFVRDKNDKFGTPIKYYNFNITRYVQQIVTKHTINYPLRLYAPYNLIYPQHAAEVIPFNNRLAQGRVKVGSGSNANYTMRLRIVYSKL
jgi:hypothetical protein